MHPEGCVRGASVRGTVAHGTQQHERHSSVRDIVVHETQQHETHNAV
jgi:hypothetical protein